MKNIEQRIEETRDAYCKEFQTEDYRYVAMKAFDMGVECVRSLLLGKKEE